MATPTHSHWQNDPAILAAARNSPALKQGATSSGVQRLREALSMMGAPSLAEPLNQFGPLTKALVIVFQTLYGLAADGVVGADTILKLEALLSSLTARKPWPTPTAVLSREDFLKKVATECGPIVKENGLPVSSMVACAAVESGWGTGKIFKDTGNLFSMQKWPWVQFPATPKTLWRTTVIQTNPRKTAMAPFNTAIDYADAGRQWCEWVLHYGASDGPPGNINQKARPADNAWAIGRRSRLVSMAGNPTEFARNLYLVSFGETHAMGELYARVLLENKLTRFD
jgi:peptidoglycan hydrolase-like protein with peptidoglycan-binding domain